MKILGGFMAFVGFFAVWAAVSTSDHDPSANLLRIGAIAFVGLIMFAVGLYLNTRKTNGGRG